MTMLFLILPEQILALFNATPEMLRIGRSALAIIPLGLTLASVSINCSVMFQAIGKGSYSMILSLMRQLVVIVPAAWALARIFGEVTAVWWAFPLSEAITIVLALFLFRRVYRAQIEPLAPCPSVV